MLEKKCLFCWTVAYGVVFVKIRKVMAEKVTTHYFSSQNSTASLKHTETGVIREEREKNSQIKSSIKVLKEV